MDEIIIRCFDISHEQDFLDFVELKEKFLNLLSLSYGKKYFGNDIYNEKIEQRNLIIFVAFYDSEIIGTLIIKDREKLSGLAITSRFRRRKIASNLIKKAQIELPYLYGEVAITSSHMKSLLKKLGFNTVSDKNLISELLTKQNDRVLFLDKKLGYYSYVHANNKYYIDHQKVFIVFEYRKLQK